ncbi:DUF397 domain-containing protein [Streptomyces sp. HNM0574]|uniref:DUF397 domain-containing protein n=1 Tax=Streptomyces sp. HNM0574 TaxID=2714954 RepID=UPI00146D9E49|nr:DUF397 domain-containing protein [Streptomyces sp. HNM0574]NLU69854.1 DUF397 domain-containing protein [Streptomyces sp. HNM0574]
MPAQRHPGDAAPATAPARPDRPGWLRSSYSTGANNCVETAVPDSGGLAVRDSKDRDGPVLRFRAEAWDAFLDGLGRAEV